MAARAGAAHTTSATATGAPTQHHALTQRPCPPTSPQSPPNPTAATASLHVRDPPSTTTRAKLAHNRLTRQQPNHTPNTPPHPQQPRHQRRPTKTAANHLDDPPQQEPVTPLTTRRPPRPTQHGRPDPPHKSRPDPSRHRRLGRGSPAAASRARSLEGAALAPASRSRTRPGFRGSGSHSRSRAMCSRSGCVLERCQQVSRRGRRLSAAGFGGVDAQVRAN